MEEEEIPLAGGNVNLGVVRVGDTVRRATSAISPTVHRLLLHLEAKGFAGSPRFLGIDDKGREILSYLPGETGVPRYLWHSDESVIATAELLRDYHDATRDFAMEESMVWGKRDPDPARHEVICHNDFAPYNFVYRSQAPYAVIDFDLVGPGPRIRDVACAAYWLTPLAFSDTASGDDLLGLSEADIGNGGRRLHLLCETYGISPTPELFDAIYDMLHFMGDREQMENLLGPEVAEKLEAEGHLPHWRREARAFEQNRRRAEANIGTA